MVYRGERLNLDPCYIMLNIKIIFVTITTKKKSDKICITYVDIDIEIFVMFLTQL